MLCPEIHYNVNVVDTYSVSVKDVVNVDSCPREKNSDKFCVYIL